MADDLMAPCAPIHSLRAGMISLEATKDGDGTLRFEMKFGDRVLVDLHEEPARLFALFHSDTYRHMIPDFPAPEIDAGVHAALIAVAEERRRQMTKEGFSLAHDDKHASGELAAAAACYALSAGATETVDPDDILEFWPWETFEWWKPRNPRRDLVRAAALILAEIERIDRASSWGMLPLATGQPETADGEPMNAVLKPSATSAAETAFCAAKVEGPGGFLWIDGNGKITAGNGTLDAPKPNAFSLLQIDDCPGSTAVCRASCYVHQLAQFAPETHALYRHNSAAVRGFVSDAADEWASVMAAWIAENCRGGFRWHVSGDIFDRAYAKWIAKVCARSMRVDHWIYTRSFDYLQPFAGISTKNGGNLAVNLSCDADNYDRAAAEAEVYGFRLCYMTADGAVPDDLPDGSVIFPDYALRGGNPAGAAWFAGLTPQQKSFVCPVDYHGKDERRRCGPCSRCLI